MVYEKFLKAFTRKRQLRAKQMQAACIKEALHKRGHLLIPIIFTTSRQIQVGGGGGGGWG